MAQFSDLFNWNNCDRFGESISFDTCTLLKDIGPYEKGKYFEMIFFDTEKLTLRFFETVLELDNDTPAMTKHLGIID